MTSVEIKRRGLMLVLSSPSGAGKTTLSQRILDRDPDVTMSVSATTRAPRPGEVEGQDYFFVSEDKFNEMEAQGAFLEHAVVFDNKYGTPRQPVEDALASGCDVLFDIDWQGTQQLDQAARDDLVKVFILPPTRKELEDRLRLRAQDPQDVVAARMAKASGEISHWAEYDYVIINEDIDDAEAELTAILAAERLRRKRLVGLADFVKTMVD